MCTGLSEMWHETFVQGYQKCDRRHVQDYQKCDTRCAQGYQKCERTHVYRIIRNVTRDMCTGLSEM